VSFFIVSGLATFLGAGLGVSICFAGATTGLTGIVAGLTVGFAAGLDGTVTGLPGGCTAGATALNESRAGLTGISSTGSTGSGIFTPLSFLYLT
jgi:hypothetical protein